MKPEDLIKVNVKKVTIMYTKSFVFRLHCTCVENNGKFHEDLIKVNAKKVTITKTMPCVYTTALHVIGKLLKIA